MSPADWRRETGLSQAAIAKLLGLDGKNPARTWQRYETGQREPGLAVIIAIERMSRGKVTARSWVKVLGARGTGEA